MEGQICPQEVRSVSEEFRCSQADECSHAEEIVSDDESAVGGEEEGDLDRINLTRSLPMADPLSHPASFG